MAEEKHYHEHNQNRESAELQIQSIRQDQVPKGRDGKHRRTITLLLGELNRLKPGSALKVPLSNLPGTKANIRAALNRATRQEGLRVATSSDAAHLYIWKVHRTS